MAKRQLDPSICDVQVEPGAVVCVEADYIGSVSVGTRTIIHPKAKIIAESGPIIIGEGNVIEELAHIVNRSLDGESRTLYIGNNNIFETGSYCEASKIGDNNVLEIKSHVGPGVELTKGCVVGAKCSVIMKEKVPENTVIYGQENNRRIQGDTPMAQGLQVDLLSKIFPNFHYLVKSKKKPAMN